MEKHNTIQNFAKQSLIQVMDLMAHLQEIPGMEEHNELQAPRVCSQQNPACKKLWLNNVLFFFRKAKDLKNNYSKHEETTKTTM